MEFGALLTAFKSMTLIEWGLSVSLLMNFRLWYKYTQMDKVILLIADRSHRDIVHIESDGNYSIRSPLNKIPTLQEKVDANL